MIRKPPLRTYQKKKMTQSSFVIYQPSNLWESKARAKRISTNRKKKESPLTLNDQTIGNLSNFGDTTFDRLAKTARLPPPVDVDSQSSIDLSSDVPIREEPSPVKTNLYQLPTRNESQRSRAVNRPKRRANQSRTVQEDAEVVLKKRLKQDLVNLSVKKAKPVRNSRRKVGAKTAKTLGNRGKEQGDRSRNLTANDSEDWFVVKPPKGRGNGKEKKKKRDLLRKKKVQTISVLSSSIGDDVGEKAKEKKKLAETQEWKDFSTLFTSMSKLGGFSEIQNADAGEEEKNCAAKESGEMENKENVLGGSVNTSRMSTVSNRTRSKLAMRNSPALDYSVNFRRYSVLKRTDDDDSHMESCTDSKKYNRILTRRQYASQTRSKLSRNFVTDASINLKRIPTRRSGHPESGKSEVEITKPCSIVLLKCEEKKDPVMSAKESTLAPKSRSYTNNSGDIYQSSISNSNQKTQDAVKIGLYESARTGEVPSSRNESDLVRNVDRKLKQDPKQRLNYLTCSTPISAFVNIDDRSINCLSPINGRGDEASEKNCNSVEIGTDKELSEVPKPTTTRRSARKRLSISYEEDKSFEPSEENCGNAMDVDKNSEHLQSPTSEIQESLQILKLDLENSNNKDNADKRGSLQEKLAATSTDSNSVVHEKTAKCCSINEFIGKTRDTCSQLTPVGIISTRSGRQLKLSMTSQEKFFDDSNDPKVLSTTSKINDDKSYDPDDEIIENSEIEIPKHRINKIRGSRFTVFKSDSKNNICSNVKRISIPHHNDSAEIQSAVVISGEERSNDSRAPGKLKTISSEIHSRCSTLGNGEESESNSHSVVDEERSNLSASAQEVLQGIIESTKHLDSLDLRSSHDDESQCSSYTENNDDDSNWSTFSSSGRNEDVQQNTKITSTSVSSSCSGNDDDNSEAGTSTSLSRENSCLTSSDVEEDNNLVSIDPQLASGNNKLDSDLTIEEGDEITKTVTDISSDTMEMALSERLKLLSTRINTRKRRKTLLKPVTENVLEVSENQAAIQTADHLELTSSVEVISTHETISEEDSKTEQVHSHNKPIGSDLLKRPSDPPVLNLQPIVLLEKLKEPARISTSETKALDSQLAAIHEISNETAQLILQNSSESSLPGDSHEEKNSEHSPLARSEKMDEISLKADRTPVSDSECGVSKLDLTEPQVSGRQSVFLKPGKNWARSLSVLNHIQDGANLELLSSGKGKNWRKSVQTILGMQRERVVQSCLGKNDDKDVQPHFKVPNHASIPEWTPCSKEQSLGSASPSRFIRRMSIRVVPDNKKLGRIEDTSFLEAYGLTTSKSRKTLSRISEAKCRKSLVYDVQCKDAAIETVVTSRVVTAKDVVFQRCCQDDYVPFTECFPPEYLENCRKIGEGVYGEVFLYERGKEKAVIKIIPIEGTALVNGERQKKFDEILSEIVIAKELHNLRFGDNYQTHGFVEVRNIKCINGKYPEELIELWKAYDDDKGSENDCPSMFDENQLYIVLELGHGGQDLEAFVFPSAVQAHALFVQTALALAVAEQSLEFEHRDLHWGNILISNTKDSQIGFKLNNKEYSYPTKGMQVAIIDFTLSRMSYEGCSIFNDLALDPALFTAEGEYQFEIYRLMKEKIENNWQKFEPYTNVLWLHYTLDKMITALRYKRKSTKVHKEAIARLQDLKDIVLNYDSAFHFVTNCDKITSFQCKSTTTVHNQFE